MRPRITIIALIVMALCLCGQISCDADDDDHSGAADDDIVDDDANSPDDDSGNDDTNDDDVDDDIVDDDTVGDDDTAPADPIDLVNLFLGTGGIGYGAAQLHPGPQMPNGMVRPGPDTSMGPLFYLPEFQHYAGYWIQDTHIRGFSQNRMIGTGDSDYGNVRLMPVFGIDDQNVRDRVYLAEMDKESELAEVGRYQVRLANSDILAETSAAKWSAIHRFSYPAGDDDPYLVVDVCGSIRPGDVSQATASIDPITGEISGAFLQEGEFSSDYGGIYIYFSLELSEPVADYGTFADGVIDPQNTEVAGDDIGVYVGFDLSKSGSVTAKVGLSHLSVDQARANLQEEIPQFDFDDIVQKNKDAWRNALGTIEVTGGEAKQRRIFYTSLYRSFIMPTLFTEHGGKYIGFDDNEHLAEGFTYYTDMSLWDTFRTLHPLITLLAPDLSRDFIVSLIAMAQQGGYLPRWPQGNGYTGSMIGTHSDVVISEAYLKGITDFDVETAYDAMVLHATQWVPHAGRSDLENYLNLGYCTTNNTGAAVSKTLEYAFDDFCIARLAEALGYYDQAAQFDQRALNYANLWDPATQFMRGRNSAGNWSRPFLPWFPWANEYTQGNARHWMWFVPHDVPGLVALFDSAQSMTDRLDEFFAKSSYTDFDGLPNLYYWHGNQHDLHSVYLFNEAGRPDLTQKWSRHILETDYDNLPNGLAGNEDGGTLTAWYVLAAIGLFPLNPCSTLYQIGSPVFDRIVLHLPGGDFTIIAQNNSTTNIYIQNATLNGEPLEVPWLDHAQIAGGGELVLTMGPQPSEWGRP